MEIKNISVEKYMWLQQRGFIQMTKKELIKQIRKIDEAYTEVALKRLNKTNLEELLQDITEKKAIERKVAEQTKLMKQKSDLTSILSGATLLSLVILCVVIIT